MPTKDKKYLWIDMTARWRIVNPLVFLQTVGTEMGAQKRLVDILDGATRSTVGPYDLINIVRSTNRILEAEKAEDVDSEQIFPEIKQGRPDLLKEIMKQSMAPIREFGIELVDVRVKRINYEGEVRTKVYERMMSERK